MRIKLFCLLTIAFLGLLNLSLQAKSDWALCINKDSMKCACKSLKSYVITKDTFQVLIKIKASLPIAWGTKYKCKIVEINNGELIGSDSSFLMSATIESEKIYQDLLSLNTNENYIIEFVKSKIYNNQAFIPVGIAGFLDKKGTIWNIRKVSKPGSAEESTYADLAN